MRVTAAFVAIAVLVTSCGREKTSVSDRPAAATTAQAIGATGRSPAWDNSVGDIVATPSAETGAPLLFVRDTGTTADIRVELFNHEGRSARAIITPLASRQSCAWERAGVLAGTAGKPSPVAWSLALAPGVATPLAIEGIGDLLPWDSVGLTTRIHRQVSAIPDDSVSTPFRGLPIVVRDAWLVRLEDSSVVAVAVAIRSLNIESNPRTEVTAIIVEHAPAWGADDWRTGFVQRSAGPEDRVEGADLLAAFHLQGDRTAVALARDGDKGLQVDIVERTAPAIWLVRWSSEALPCAR
jgi:hypothetical protein